MLFPCLNPLKNTCFKVFILGCLEVEDEPMRVFEFKILCCRVLISSHVHAFHFWLSLNIYFIWSAFLSPRVLSSVSEGVDPMTLRSGVQPPACPFALILFLFLFFLLFFNLFIFHFILFFPPLFYFWLKIFQHKLLLFFPLLFYYTFFHFIWTIFGWLLVPWILMANEVD